jgi:hypothetical protein
MTLAGGGEPPVFCGRCGQHREHRRRAAHVRHAVLGDHREDQRRIDLAQAYMRAAHRHHRPRKTPAVAVKHRQRPEIDRLRRQRPGHGVADGFQKRTAMMINHTLRIAGGT